MAKFLSLFSGSGGNCEYVSSSKHGILIDAGRSAKQIAEALLQREIDPSGIEAMFITHEHIDHSRGIRVFAAKYNVPVYATEGTACALIDGGLVDERTDLRILDGEITTGDMSVKFFHTSHDTPESCGYTVETGDGRRASVCTDLGVITDEVRKGIEGSDLVLLESNHDLDMLMNGPYPYMLKKRISGTRGHLSNEDCDRELVRLVKAGAVQLFLGHLSRENNLPELARQAASAELTTAGMKENFDYKLYVCPPKNNGKVTIF